MTEPILYILYQIIYQIKFVIESSSGKLDIVGRTCPNFHMFTLAFSKLFRKLGVLLHPTTCGPYLLELADPLGQLVVEWDSSWTLYPPWRQDRHREFVQRKHFHLRAEGWKLIVIPLDTFSALSSDQKRGFLDSFCNEQKLNYLRVGNMPEAAQVIEQKRIAGVLGHRWANCRQMPPFSLHRKWVYWFSCHCFNSLMMVSLYCISIWCIAWSTCWFH